MSCRTTWSGCCAVTARPVRLASPSRSGRYGRQMRSCHDIAIGARGPVLLPVLRGRGPGTAGRGGRRVALPLLHQEFPAAFCRNRCSPMTAADVTHVTLGGLGYAFGPADDADDRHVEDPQHMRSLAEQAAEELEDASAEDVVRWATDTFGDRICITSSMSDAVVIHLVSALSPVNLVNVTPSRTVAEQDAELGPRLYGRNPDLCCYLRKVEPLEKSLAPYDAWFTGVRREETASRRGTRVVEWDEKRQMIKVNPIVAWTGKQVDDYIAENGVLVNPLVYDGSPSIGCRTCTMRVEAGADPRSGRWAGTGKTECGIHV